MNLADRIRSFFQPQAMRIEPMVRESRRQNSSRFGGSKSRTLPSWYSAGDIDYTRIREQSRSAWIDSVQVRSIVNRIIESAVNSGLYPEPKPTYDLVDPSATPEQKEQWERVAWHRFDLWARSTDPSTDRSKTFYQVQREALMRKLIDGESLIICRYLNATDRVSPLSLQIIDPSNLSTPSDSSSLSQAKALGHRVVDGIEIDNLGRPVAYFIQDQETNSHVRIPARGSKSGRVFILHTFIPAMPGDTRGASPLAPVLHELSKITDYSVAELQAAVVNATIAGWVKPSAEQDSSRPLSGVQRRDSVSESPSQPDPPVQAELTQAGVFIQNLRAGEEIQSYDTRRPNVNFEAFVGAVMKHVSAALSVPVEVLYMTFSQNYSASRASLLLFWNTIRMWRADLSSWLLSPVYEQWLAEEIQAGNIQAPGFQSVIGRRAWSRCNWIGINHPSIDPLKEANAATVRIHEGLTTRDREAAAYNGSDFADNVAELNVENQQLSEANAWVDAILMAEDVEDE